MAVKFTDDQKKAIKARGTVLVAAAAGSGKTAVLTERVIKRICDPNDPASIDRMLIVTFTNASALEMRVRIGKKLDEYCAEHPENTIAHKQKILLRSAKICTIDSFCGDLVRKYFGQLGVEPDFSVATNVQTAALKEKAIKEVLAVHFANPDNQFNKLCDSFGIYKGERNLIDAILSIYDYSLCMSSPELWLDSAVDNYFIENLNESCFSDALYSRARQKLLAARDSAEFILRECVGTEFEEAWFHGFSDTVEQINKMLDSVDSKEWDRLYNSCSSFEKTAVATVRKPTNPELRDIMKHIRDKKIYNVIISIADDMCGNSADVLAELRQTGELVRCLVDLVKEFSDKYYKLLLSKNILTFSLIEQLALKLLCTQTLDGLIPSELSKDICKLYDEVLVDEYQDNNDLQDSLFFAVSDSGKHLFMVGDVKQSIYGFRNANPDNFLKHKNTYSDYDGIISPSKVILSSNFRSRKGVCDFVNAVCSSLMQKETCGMEYTQDEILVSDAEFPENSAPSAEINIVNNSDNTIDRDTADAESVADYILSVLNEEPFLRKSKTELRKAEYKDFAILLRSPKPRVKYYIEALRRRGIPALFESGEFYESAEVLTAVSILKIINNPLQDIPLLAAMTSVAFGFTYDEVANIKSTYKFDRLYKCVIMAAKNGDIKCINMIDTLSALRKKAITMSVGALINEIYRSTYIMEILSSFPDGIQKKSNLFALQTMATEFENFSDGSLSGFIDHFDRASEEKASGDKSVGSDTNAVRIMSFHGSKGLQFPVCILAGCGGGFNKKDLNKPVITNGKYGIGIDLISDGIKHKTVARNVLKEAQLLKIISEEIRLLYVAMTRAEERLMISISSNDFIKDIEDAVMSLGMAAYDIGKIPPESVLSAVGPKRLFLCSALLQKCGAKLCEAAGLQPISVNGCGEYKLSISKSIKPCDNSTETIDNAERFSFDTETENDLNERFNYKYPFDDACYVPSKLAVTELVHGNREQFAFKSRPRFMSKAGLTPAERGTAMHKFMQFADFTIAEVDIDAEVSRLYEYEFISSQEADSINREQLKKFFKSQIYARIKASPKVMREYKFMVKYPYKNQETIIQGIADCMFVEDGKIVIIDFKTDNVSDMNALKERYSQQLQIYKEAVSEIFELPVSECVIYSLKLSQEINV